MNPRITIITVCYNSDKYIEEAIRSVIKQTYKNLEYIIVDGGSDDNTLNIIEKYRDSISLVISEPDEGISDAFNKGIRASTGDIIGIVNSDDMLYKEDVIENIAKAYEPSIDVYRGREFVRNFETGYEYLLCPTMEFKKNPITFHVCHMATYIRRDAFKKYGGYRVDFKYAMDLELLYRFNYLGASSKSLDLVVGVFRIGGVSQTYNDDKRKECESIILATGGNRFDVFIYSMSLRVKDFIRTILNIFGLDIASKLRYGWKTKRQ